MNDYFIVDVHTHPYETKELGIENMSGYGQFDHCGTIDELSAIMDTAAIDISIQLSVIADRNLLSRIARHSNDTTPDEWEKTKEAITDHIKRRNEWVCNNAVKEDKLKAFICVDPSMGPENMVEEILDRVRNFGAKGIKLFPAMGCYFPGDPLMDPVYETATRYNIPIISHGGLYVADKEYTAPRNYIPVFEKFPDLTFVIAHLGRTYYDETVEISKRFPHVSFDTSSAIPGDADGKILRKAEKFLGPLLGDDEAVYRLREIGIERVMFGSDFPWFHPGYDIKRIMNLPLSEDEKRAILGLNALDILRL